MPTLGSTPFGVGNKAPGREAHDKERVRRLEEAKAFLRQRLADGPQPAKVLLKAATTAGIAERTLHRAKDLLGVSTERAGGYGAHGQWIWHPPAMLALPQHAAIGAGAIAPLLGFSAS